MSRKITKEAVNAFLAKQKFNKANMSVWPTDYETIMRLHGNIIATLDHATNILCITNCGWFSNTTKERLNALPGVSIYQKKGIWYLNGKEWNGNLITINNAQ